MHMLILNQHGYVKRLLCFQKLTPFKKRDVTLKQTGICMDKIMQIDLKPVKKKLCNSCLKPW